MATEPPKGVGKTCLDCKRYIDDGYCDYTCWNVGPIALNDPKHVIPERGCLAYQHGLGNFEPREEQSNDASVPLS